MKRQYVSISLGLVLTFVIGFGGGVLFDRSVLFQGAPPSEPADARATFGVFWEAWRQVEQHYVDPSVLTPVNLTHGAIAGMVDALVDTGHSRFLTPKEVKAEQQSLAGTLEGIGVTVEMRDTGLTIVAPLDGSPAQKAGLMPGDVIEKVDGQDVTHMTLDQASQIIRGPRGTSVHLVVLRPGASEFLNFTVVRQEIQVPLVTWATIPGQHVALIRISEFGDRTDDQLRNALTEAKAAGDTSVVLDLRNDPGGLLDQAVRVTSEFVSKGNVLFEQDRSGTRKPLPVTSGGIATSVPLVVLVNHGTASAAEIVAGALQDHSRAQIVGDQTFGTGTVLNEFRLSDGSAILLGVEEWLTPNGHVIWKNGITPNRVIAEPPSVQPLLPEELRTMSVTDYQKRNDTQIKAALQILQSQAP